ncbi:MAG: hypothetical protein D9N14_22320 [Ketobacter sp.]|nr:MAG: hypothetical protein D9N14_22320 [Ketobacter sp.]
MSGVTHAPVRFLIFFIQISKSLSALGDRSPRLITLKGSVFFDSFAILNRVQRTQNTITH